jgi:hypothetical protein
MAYALDYIDVAQRIADFRAKHPEGSLQPANIEQPYTIEKIDNQTYIVVVAAAYRSPDDPKPGIGMAYEIFPGKTNFTRGSELQNAETSAWGRAIVAAMAGDTKKGIASAEEVRNRKEEQKSVRKSSVEGPKDDARVDELCARMDSAETVQDLQVIAGEITKLDPRPNDENMSKLQYSWKTRKAVLS